MSILERFSDIIKANINDLLDKAEDPAKMIDQYMRELTDDLAEVREETASVIAEEKRSKRQVDDNAEQVKHYDELARQALKAGNEGDARIFLAKKQSLETEGKGLKEAYEVAHQNANKMREMHDKLVSDIETLNARRSTIKAKTSVAKTQQKVNDLTSGSDKAEGAMSAFARMEAKADQMLDEANAQAELQQTPTDRAAELEKQYAEAGNTKAVDEELERLKKEMGLE
jgi:phage shock protein A